MTNQPALLDARDTRLSNPDTIKGMILGVLQTQEDKGEFGAHAFPWTSEKEMKELNREGLIYLNRQTEKGIYAKLTEAGRQVDWMAYVSPWNKGKHKRKPLPRKDFTMRELLAQGMKEVADNG